MALSGASRAAAIVAVIAMGACTTSGAQVETGMPERVHFESRGDAAHEIEALLYRPSGAVPASGFPAIVALHGCSGMRSTLPGREIMIGYEQRAMAFVAAGYVVLVPDSFGARGVREVCTIPAGQRTVTPNDRRHDAFGALRYLAATPGIDRERIALIGYSHGGSTVLATVDARNAPAEKGTGPREADPAFRAAVAFYPGCRVALRAGNAYRPVVPTQIHIGAIDDWTPAAPCIALGEAMRERGEPLTVDVYADSHHAFDAPSGRIVHRDDVSNGVKPREGVTLGPNPEARDLANRRVAAFLAERLAR